MTPKQLRFFEIARQVSFLSDFKRIKMGSILVRNKKVIISSGANMRKSHPHQYALNQTHKQGFKADTSFIHSELSTLMSVKFIDISGCELYLYREDLNGNIADSYPCESCMAEIVARGLIKVHFTTPNGYGTIRLH